MTSAVGAGSGHAPTVRSGPAAAIGPQVAFCLGTGGPRTSARLVDQAVVHGEQGGLGAVGELELGQDGGHVGLDRLLRHEQARGQLAVRQAQAEQGQHLALAGGELVEPGSAPPGEDTSARSRAATAGSSTEPPRWTVRMAASSSLGGTSLPSQPLAPARTAASAWSSPPKLVSTSTRGGRVEREQAGEGGHAAAAGQHEVEQHDVGRELARRRRPRRRRPPASPTTSKPVAGAEERAQPLAHDRVVVDHQRCGSASRRSRRPGTSARTVVPCAGLGLDGERPAELGRPAPASTRGRGGGRSRRGRAGRSRCPSSSTSSATRAVRRGSRRTTIWAAAAWRTALVTRLLRDAEQGLLGVGRRAAPRLRRRRSAIGDAVGAAHHLEVLGQARHQPLELERRRAQLEDRATAARRTPPRGRCRRPARRRPRGAAAARTATA